MGRTATPRSSRRWLAAALIPLSVAACDSATDLPPTRTTTLNVYLKDQPGDVDSVWVQIDDVVLLGDSGQVDALDAPTGLINVTSLRDSVATLSMGVDLPYTSFHEVRLMVGGAVLQSGSNVYTMGGAEPPQGLQATGTLDCPSCTETGIKVKLTGDLQWAEGNNGLLLDFDVSQSFGREGGDSGQWVMDPVIHGTGAEPAAIDDGTAQEKILGTVALGVNEVTGDPLAVPACGGADRTLAAFVPTATATTLTDGEGSPLMFSGSTAFRDDGQGGGSWAFEIDLSGDDTYTMGHTAETLFDTEKLVWTATAAPDSVAVPTGGDGTQVDAAYLVTAVACQPITTP